MEVPIPLLFIPRNCQWGISSPVLATLALPLSSGLFSMVALLWPLALGLGGYNDWLLVYYTNEAWMLGWQHADVRTLLCGLQCVRVSIEVVIVARMGYTSVTLS